MTRSTSPRDGSRFWASRGPELVDALRDTMTQIRVLQAKALDLVADMDREQVAPDAGYASLAGFLTETIRVAPPQAQRMVAHAEQITETKTRPDMSPPHHSRLFGWGCSKACWMAITLM